MAQNFRFSETAFWIALDVSDFSFLSSRESGICDEMMERLRILDSQRLIFVESWMLLAFLVRIGNP